MLTTENTLTMKSDESISAAIKRIFTRCWGLSNSSSWVHANLITWKYIWMQNFVLCVACKKGQSLLTIAVEVKIIPCLKILSDWVISKVKSQVYIAVRDALNDKLLIAKLKNFKSVSLKEVFCGSFKLSNWCFHFCATPPRCSIDQLRIVLSKTEWWKLLIPNIKIIESNIYRERPKFKKESEHQFWSEYWSFILQWIPNVLFFTQMRASCQK